jgi:hypothetical protein
LPTGCVEKTSFAAAAFVVAEVVIGVETQLVPKTATIEYPYVVLALRPVSAHEGPLTVQTTAGLPGPLVRVTRYCAPSSCVPGLVQPMVICDVLFGVAVGVVGAFRLAAAAVALPLALAVQNA